MALHEILTDAELAELCHAKDHIAISSRVVKISNEAVIKYGWNLQPEEAQNLRIAGAILDPAIIRVPKFYRYFTHGEYSYLVMEYIEGRTPPESEYEDLANKIVNVLRYFRSIRGDIPGSLSGGISRGYFWESDFPNFQTTKQLEDWMNKRAQYNPKISLQGRDLVLCHLDLAPRNIIQGQKDGSLYLLDWESAGYYPESFELAGLGMTNMHTTRFEYILREKLGKDLGADDATFTENKTMIEAWLRGDRTYFKPTEISNRPPPFDITAYMARNGLLSTKTPAPAQPSPTAQVR
ncbi:hypothetical protein TWF506_004519 [Arthrobotrys conoides]|uniref:Aminoglycoside phosphotransferase domain-containing protein n=1 Tax=Arthrobotrys conoides TaxID=74498 RepID=A0AAN8RIE4_9PEZI